MIRAVTFARANGLPISIRGGGHNVAGHAVGDDAVMIDLSAMRGVRVDPERRRALVEGGATWGDVDVATQAFGLATPGGLISDTGVGGLTLSGGIGWLRSRHGLCIDNLVSADVVTANGQLIHASSDENADLLWALKGGGGNFGVVTTLEFALHPIGPTVMFCGPVYPIESGSAPIRFWREFLKDKNDRVGSLIEFSTIPNDPGYPEAAWGERVYTIAAVFAGDPDEGEALLQPLRELGEMVTDYLERNASPPSPNTLSSIWNFGGATAAVGAADTAFGDRSMPWMVSIDSVWTAPEDDAANIAWTRDFWDRLTPYSHKGRLYLNFAGFGEGNEELVRRSFGDNFADLGAIKRKYDPDNVFRFNQNIQPSG